MWIPDWLYERLPLVYAAAGCLCVFGLGSSFAAQLSALLFFGAAALTFGRRRSARALAAAAVRRRQSAVRGAARREAVRA